MNERSVPQTLAAHPLVSEVVAPDKAAAQYAPQSVMGSFDRAFDLYKRHAIQFISAASVVLIPAHILMQLAHNFWLSPLVQSMQGASEMEQVSSAFQVLGATALVGSPDAGVPGVLAALAFCIASVPVTLTTSRLLLGQPAPPRRSFRVSLRLYIRQGVAWSLAGLTFVGGYALWFALFCIVVFVILAGASAAPGANSALAGVLGVLLFVAPYVLACRAVACAFILAAPLIVIEHKTPVHAATRNAQLIPKPMFRKVWLATAALPIAILGLQGLLISSIASLATSLHVQPLLGFWIQTALSVLLSLFFQPYAMIFFTLLYYDMAFRRDGLDIRLLIESAGLSAPTLPNAASPSLSTPLAPPNGARRTKP